MWRRWPASSRDAAAAVALAAALIVAAVAPVARAAPSPAGGAPSAPANARDLHRRGGYPDRLRRFGDDTFSPTPASSGVRVRRAAKGSSKPSAPIFDLPTTAVAQFVLWSVLVMVVLAIIAGIAQVLMKTRRPPEAPVIDDLAGVGRAIARELGVDENADASALATEGNYREAILVVLLRALRTSGLQPKERRAATTRELIAALDRDDPRRHDLDRLRLLAETVRFGGVEATAADYEQARTALAALQGGARS